MPRRKKPETEQQRKARCRRNQARYRERNREKVREYMREYMRKNGHKYVNPDYVRPPKMPKREEDIPFDVESLGALLRAEDARERRRRKKR